MEPFQIEQLKFSESNSEDHVLIEREIVTGGLIGPVRKRWDMEAFPRKEEVIALRDWLNAWLDTHVFVVPPRA